MEKVLLAEFENELEDQFDDGFVSREEKAVLHMNLNYNIRKNSKYLGYNKTTPVRTLEFNLTILNFEKDKT